jgi:hypothetical protein
MSARFTNARSLRAFLLLHGQGGLMADRSNRCTAEPARCGPLPADARQFAQMLLGTNGLITSDADAPASSDRSYHEWLARISPRHEIELRRLSEEQAEAGHQQRLSDFLARILSVQEADWDPAKHPRGGYPENRGWFSPKWGATGAIINAMSSGLNCAATTTLDTASATGRAAWNALSGMLPTYGIVTDDNRKQLIATAKAELDAAVRSNKISQPVADIRLETVKAVLSGALVDEDTEKFLGSGRDKNLWQLNSDKKWFFSGSAIAAIDAAYNAKGNDRIGFLCRTAAQFQILRGQTAVFDNLQRQGFDLLANGDTPGSLFPEYNDTTDGNHKGIYTEVERNSRAGIDPNSLLPGDQTWIKNRRGEDADAGSNKFYIGGGQFADPYTTRGLSVVGLQNYAGYLQFVHGEAGHPNIAPLKIVRVVRPIVPNYKAR